jgi:hypothetical protein
VVVTDGDSGRISAYRAADGRRLWRRTFPETTASSTELRFGTVIGGQVRVVELRRPPPRCSPSTRPERPSGLRTSPMFAQGGDPQPVGGDYGTLIINDVNDKVAHGPHPYVLLTAGN